MRFRRHLILLAALILTLVSGATAAADGLRLGLMETADTTPIEVRVDGQLFVIPLNFFRYPPLPNGAEDTGFVLRVLLPDLEPYTLENASEFNRGGHGRKMNILLEGRDRLRPLGELFNDNLQGNAATPPSAATFGLAHGYNKYDGDFFAYERNGSVSALIRCDVYTPPYDPSCRHLFLWSQFYVKLSYGRKNLKQWCQIEQRVRTLLTRISENPVKDNSDTPSCP